MCGGISRGWRRCRGLPRRRSAFREHVRQLALDKGFGVREDGVGNMVVEVPASPGCENAPIIVLQGHLDMVCARRTATRSTTSTTIRSS